MIKILRKNYDLCIDVAFWVTLAMSMIALTRNLGLHSFITTGIISVFSIPLQIFMWISLIALVTVPQLRDEYAEKLWHRAAIGFVYIVILIPPIMMILGASFQTPIEAWLEGLNTSSFIFRSSAKSGPAVQQFYGVMKITLLIAAYAPLVFVSLYKWHRWRDSV